MNSYKILFFFVILHFGTYLQAQNKEEKVPLTQILTQLESRYSCKFNYVVEITKHISSTLPQTEWSLERAVGHLQIETGLKFTILLNNFISIEPRKPFVFCGYLKDLDTKEPVIAATIQTSTVSVISNEKGYFELTINDNKEVISFRHLGYKLKFIPMDLVHSGSCDDIFMTQQEEQLSEVFLTDFLTKGIDKLSDGSYLLNLSNSVILPGLIESDVLQTIQELPGVQSIDETVSDINIRGGTNDQNLFIWDGIKMYQSGHFFGLISIYNPMVTQHAKLTKNGSRVDLTDGVSGTIEMGTDDSINNEFKGSLGFNFINTDAFLDMPLGKKSSIQIATRKSLSNYLETPTYNSYTDRILQGTAVGSNMNNDNSDSEFDFHDVNVRWLWQINEKNKIRLNFLNTQNEFDYYEKTEDLTEESRSSNLFQTSWVTGLFFERTWSDKFQSQLQVYESDYNLKAINSTFLKGQRLVQENQVSETGIKLNNYYTLNDRWQLLHGYQFTETQILNSDVVDDPLYRLKVFEVLRTHAIYGQFNYASKNNETRFNAGIRLNYLGKFNKYLVEPRISFNQKFLNHFTFEVLGELKHQSTSQLINVQNDFLGIEKRRWQLANDKDIPIIKSRQLSLGLHYSAKGWLISAETYYKFITGITAQGQGFQNQYEFITTNGGYEAYGFDYLIRKKWKHIGTWLSYSNMENHYSFESFRDAWFPNNLEIYNSITFGSSVDLNNLKIALGCNWHTGKPTTRPIVGNEIIDQRINYEPANTSRLDDYFRIDFSTTYKFNFSDKVRGDFGIAIWNILNRQNSISNYYRINNAQQLPVKETKMALPLTPNASFRLSF